MEWKEYGIGEQDVKTYIGGTVLAAKGWEFEDGRSYFGVRFQPGSCILPEELSIRDLVNKDLEIDGNLFGDHLTGCCPHIAPALCPNSVTQSGFPPKARMFRCTHCSAHSWS